MNGFLYAPPVADDYRRPIKERVRVYAWSAVGLLVAGGCAMVLAWVIAYGSALGSNLSSLCFDVAPPSGYAPESLVERRSSGWPMGSDCVFGDRDAGDAVIREEDWTASYVMLVAATFTVGGVVTGLAALRAGRIGTRTSRCTRGVGR